MANDKKPPITKEDIVKFGKWKGHKWGDLLNSEDGRGWLNWWMNTQSTGKWANYENSKKNIVREWLGESKVDTRAGAQLINSAFIMNKLEIIEKLLNKLLEKAGVTAWEHEDIVHQKDHQTRVEWEE